MCVEVFILDEEDTFFFGEAVDLSFCALGEFVAM